MKMRAILHIGTEKTGTTTIQNTIYQNRSPLRQNGIALANKLNKPNNRKLASYCLLPGQFDDFLLDNGVDTEEKRRDYFKDFNEDFEQDLARAASSGAEIFFITSEHFHSRLTTQENINRLATFLRRYFSQITIIGYFREQTQLVRSLFSTSIRAGSARKFKKFCKDCSPDNVYYNYHQMLSMWAKAFGKANLSIHLYDRSSFPGGNICKHLLQQIKPDIDLSTFDFSGNDDNVSLGLAGLELGRLSNKINKKKRPDGKHNPHRGAVLQILEESALGKHGTLSWAGQRKVYTQFLKSNQAFAREFLGLAHSPFAPPADSEQETDPAIPLSQILPVFEAVMKTYVKVLKQNASYTDSLRDLAIKLEDHPDFTLKDAKLLMETARLFRPYGPLLNEKINSYTAALAAADSE